MVLLFCLKADRQRSTCNPDHPSQDSCPSRTEPAASSRRTDDACCCHTTPCVISTRRASCEPSNLDGGWRSTARWMGCPCHSTAPKAVAARPRDHRRSARRHTDLAEVDCHRPNGEICRTNHCAHRSERKPGRHSGLLQLLQPLLVTPNASNRVAIPDPYRLYAGGWAFLVQHPGGPVDIRVTDVKSETSSRRHRDLLGIVTGIFVGLAAEGIMLIAFRQD